MEMSCFSKHAHAYLGTEPISEQNAFTRKWMIYDSTATRVSEGAMHNACNLKSPSCNDCSTVLCSLELTTRFRFAIYRTIESFV